MKFRRINDETRYLRIVRDDRQHHLRHARGWRLDEYIDGKPNGHGLHQSDEELRADIISGRYVLFCGG